MLLVRITAADKDNAITHPRVEARSPRDERSTAGQPAGSLKGEDANHLCHAKLTACLSWRPCAGERAGCHVVPEQMAGDCDTFVQARFAAKFQAIAIPAVEMDDIGKLGPLEGPVREGTGADDRVAPPCAFINNALLDSLGIVEKLDPMAGRSAQIHMMNERIVTEAKFVRYIGHEKSQVRWAG